MNKIINAKTNVIFNVEKVKNNSVPKHFFTATKKFITIDGVKVEVMMNAERTQYVAFQLTHEVDGKPFVQSYYVRDHSFFEGDKYVEVKKPSKTAPVEEVKA